MRITPAADFLPSSPRDASLEAFLKALLHQGLAPATVRAYAHDVRLFLEWLDNRRGRETPLQALEAVHLVGYRGYLTDERHKRPATVKRRLEGVRRLLRWAHQQAILPENLADGMRTVAMQRGPGPKGLHEPEVHALLRAAGESNHGQKQRNYALVQFFLQTGVRVDEAARLQVGDVTVRDRTGTVRVRYGKGGKEREIPLNSTARRALRSYLETRAPILPGDPLFVSRRSQAMSVRAMQHLVHELARRAPVSRLAVSPHTLRHTFALNYLKRSPNAITELATLMGHESLEATAVYLRPSMEDLAAGVERSALNVDR